ncbi:phosphonoacetaldehyde hydrolase [uncultured Megasphaera sp.]|uniref:phosphonoacetaldehyde hydrolase n=1 Tax=uncultured Megasphaera sp. TaxID=165188 RepID=UPI002659A937|nr:phosphonoacetaldehyde hydrolase [uncultured Megasphaera sp.]
MKLEGVIFDWAGTTVDFGCMAPVKAFMDSFAANGVTVTEEETRKPMGMLKRDHIKTMLSMDRIGAAWKEKHGTAWKTEDIETIYSHFEPELLSTLTNYTKVKPGVIETIAKLRDMGLKIGSTTGYTDVMMDIVAKVAAEQGYKPDCWFSPDSTNGMGRPYPYMIFKNMMELKLSDVKHVVKVGDTVSDIKEGKAAGVWSVGVMDGSSVMGLNEDQFNAMTAEEKAARRDQVRKVFAEAGADYIIQDMTELPALLETIQHQ